MKLLLILLLATPLFAEDLKVGDDAPPFKAGGDLINPPEFARTYADCKGDVVVVMEWCIGDPKMRKLPELQKRWEQYGNYGLTVFTVHRLDHNKLPQVRAYCRREKLTLPVAMGGFYDEKNEFGKYTGDKGFWTTIVDVDGKVAWFGKDDFIEALDKELARINYPRIGKHAVAKEAEKAGKKLKEREYGEALVEAEKVLAAGTTDAAREDLVLIQETLTGLAEARLKRVEEWKEARRWDLVLDQLEVLKEEYKRHKIGDDAKAEIGRIKKDKSLKQELAGWENLQKLLDKNGEQGGQILVNALKAFAKANPGLGASAYAEQLAAQRQAELEK